MILFSIYFFPLEIPKTDETSGAYIIWRRGVDRDLAESTPFELNSGLLSGIRWAGEGTLLHDRIPHLPGRVHLKHGQFCRQKEFGRYKSKKAMSFVSFFIITFPHHGIKHHDDSSLCRWSRIGRR